MSKDITWIDSLSGIAGQVEEPDFWYSLSRLLLDYVEMGGWVMPPLLVLLVLLWYGIGYRYSVLKRGSRKDVRTQLRYYTTGKWSNPRDVVQEAIVRGLEIKRSGKNRLRRRLDDAFGEFDGELNKFSVLIRIIVKIAPLLGLLGTVTGMIETFDSLQDNALFRQSGGVAGGISQALLTTQLGLSVAIPGLIVQNLLNRKQQKIRFEIDQVKDLLISGKDSLPRQ